MTRSISPTVKHSRATTLNQPLKQHGGEGSGNFDHAGRPGLVGGSQPSAGGVSRSLSEREKKFVQDYPTLYHLTSKGLRSRILTEGIRQSPVGFTGAGVYLAMSPEQTQYYETLESGEMVKVDTEKLVQEFGLYHYKENPTGRVEYDEDTGEVVVRTKLLPAYYLNIKTHGGKGSGNFDHAGRPGLVGGSAPSNYTVDELSLEDEEILSFIGEQVGEWEGARGEIAASAIDSISTISNGMVISDEDDNVKAIASYNIESKKGFKDLGMSFAEADVDDVFETDRVMYIGNLATAERGWGRTAMQNLVNIAASEKAGILLSSTDSSIPFYEALGMRRGSGYYWGSGYYFYFTPDDVIALSQSKRNALARIDESIEPDDGAFAVTKNSKRP